MTETFYMYPRGYGYGGICWAVFMAIVCIVDFTSRHSTFWPHIAGGPLYLYLMPFFPISMVLVGVGFILLGFVARFEVDDWEIRQYNGFGKLSARVPWTHVTRFSYPARRYRYPVAYPILEIASAESTVQFFEYRNNFLDRALSEVVEEKIPPEANQLTDGYRAYRREQQIRFRPK